MRLEPSNGIYRAWLSDFSRDEKEKKEIIKLLAKPTNSLEFYGLGVGHMWLDGEAVPSFDRAISLEPQFTMAYFERGMLSADGPSNPAKAFTDMTTVIGNLQKDNIIKGIAFYIRGSMGNSLKKDVPSVLADLSRAIQILGVERDNPYLFAAYKERAETYFNIRRYDQAIGDYSTLINLDKNSDAYNYYNRAKVYFAKGDYPNTISDCSQAIKITSDENSGQGPFGGFYTLRADAYQKIGRNDLANADRLKAEEIKVRLVKPVLGGEPAKRNNPSASKENALPSTRGKKSDRLYISVHAGGRAGGGGNVAIETIFATVSEFNELMGSRLTEKGLTVLTGNEGDRIQFTGGFISRDDEGALRLMPVSLVLLVTIEMMNDEPKNQGIFVCKVSGKIEIIDTQNNKTGGIERFEGISGFGGTQEQARTNSMRSAAGGITDAFLNRIREKAR